ncbi:MAG: DUF6159 family protein [bacterium]
MDKIEQLKNFITASLQTGMSSEEITHQLRTSGWDEATITKAFAEVRKIIKPAPVPSTDQSPNNPTQAGAQIAANGQKRGRLKTSWLLFKQSLKLLKNNKQLIRYPSMSLLVNTFVTVLFAPIFFFGYNYLIVEGPVVDGSSSLSLSPAGMAVAFIYYVISFFFVYIYSAGLAAHILDIFHGKSDHYKKYMKIAWSKSLIIFVYSVITTTVGIILGMLERRGTVGNIASRLFGAVWSLANLFTVPIIIDSEMNAPQAIKESARLFIARWGENIAGRLTFGGITMLFYMFIFVPIMIIVSLGLIMLGPIGIVLAIILFILATITFAIVQTTASNVLSVALYFYAKYQQIPPAFDPSLLNSVFIAKKAKK